jgi:hypothetical protein
MTLAIAMFGFMEGSNEEHADDDMTDGGVCKTLRYIATAIRSAAVMGLSRRLLHKA